MSRPAANRDLIAWAFLLSGLSLAAADLVVLASLGFARGEQAELVWFLPRLLLGLPLLAGSLAWLLATMRGALAARGGRRAGLVFDALCTLPFAGAVLELVSGPQISISPWRWPLAAVAFAAVVGSLFALRWLARTIVQRTQGAVHAAKTQAIAFALLIATTAGACVLTARLFHNLYPAFHQAVTLGALVLCAAIAYPVIALQPAPRRFATGPALVALVVVWHASGLLTWHAAAGRRVFAETAPFTGIFVPAVFRSDAALRSLGRERSASDDSVQHGPRRAPLASFGFRADAKKPSVLLVTVDAMRGDALDPASAYAPATPELREVATRALHYERAYASSNGTNRSLPVILSGVVNGTGLMPAEQFLTSAFAANGYDTQAWVTNNYHRADDEIAVLRKVGYFCRAFNGRYAAADEVTAWARATLSSSGGPVFVWIHLSDVHAPFNLPAKPVPAGRVLPNEYARRLAGVDVELARLLRTVQASGDVIWALTADHGEALGEHGTVGHNSTLYDEQVRVPFVIGGAGIAAGRVRDPVSTQDLAATLLRLAGASIPAGVTLLPPWNAEARDGSAPVLSYMNDACSLVQGDWKLIADTRNQSLALFDLASDPAELHGRLHDEPQRARSMLAAMRSAGCRADLGLLAASLER